MLLLKNCILPPLLLAVVAAGAVVSAAAAEDRANKSSSLGSVFWATSTDRDESDLVTRLGLDSEEDHTSAAEEDATSDGFDGGFPSLEGMLQWAIGHSDPERLKEKAKEVQRLSKDDLRKRQLEIKELMERLKMPSDAELMQLAIGDLNNSSISLEDRRRALNELLFLVEPIDNANDLDKLGGLVALIRELLNSEPDIRVTSAWILGKASQNNPLVQNQILAHGALQILMKMVSSNFKEEAVKALYAISALIRNNEVGQELFSTEEGNIMLMKIMTDPSSDIRLRKKAAYLVADLADYKMQHTDISKLQFLGDRLFLKAVVDLMSSSDLDLQEKALLAIRSLLQLNSTAASDFKEFCSLDSVLEKMKQNLDKLLLDEDIRDYVKEIESLHKEVYTILNWKIEEATWVPT